MASVSVRIYRVRGLGNDEHRKGQVMFTVHGAFDNPKTAREFIRFSSPKDYATRQEAEQLMKDWQNEKRYKFVWIDERG